jgi:alcohol dehydrogenase (NADP+)
MLYRRMKLLLCFVVASQVGSSIYTIRPHSNKSVAFHPLIQHNCGPDTRVGIVGLGGLGHFGVLGASKALKCKKVVVISRTSTKKADALKMGATDFIATDEDKDWSTKHAGTLDVIVSTVSSHNMPLDGYLQLLARKGTYVHVGAPEDKMPGFSMFSLIPKRASIQGSQTGSPRDIKEMLELFAKEGVHTWNVNRPMKEANQAVVDLNDGKARYRYVLVNE